MHIRNITLAALAFATVAFAQVAQLDSGFQENYAENLNIGESYINIINTGANGAPVLGPSIISSLTTATGNLCVNVYAIDPNEELVACCSCFITPLQTVHLGVVKDLTSNAETSVVPTAVTVVLAATLAGTGAAGTATNCQYSAALAASVVNGMAAWGTTLQSVPYSPGVAVTRGAFIPVSGAAGSSLTSLAGRCANTMSNASNHGICKSCSFVGPTPVP
jgi:hypothetical protein